AVLDGVEGADGGGDSIERNARDGSGVRGGHHVFGVVEAGDGDFGERHQRFGAEKNFVFTNIGAAEPGFGGGGEIGKAAADGIGGVQDGVAAFALHAEEIAFGGDVVLHRAVAIEMILG